MAFTVRYRVRFGDIDRAGIAYYPKILHLAHCAFEDWWADGLARPYPRLLEEDRLGFPAVHLDVDFVHMIRYGDEVEIEVVVLDVGNTSAEFGFRFLDPRAAEEDPGADPRLFCRVRKTAVAVDIQTGQKRAIPDRWRAAFEANAADAATWGGDA